MNDPQFRRDLWALERVKYNETIKPAERFKKYKVEPDDVNVDLTTEQIVTNLLNGTEYFDPRDANRQIIIDNEADITWKILERAYRYRRASGSLSIGIRGSTRNFPAGRNGTILDSDYPIYTHSWFTNSVASGEQDVFNLVEHLSHEWSHKFGFIDTKPGKPKNRQLFSYVFGRMVEAAAKRVAVKCLN